MPAIAWLKAPPSSRIIRAVPDALISPDRPPNRFAAYCCVPHLLTPRRSPSTGTASRRSAVARSFFSSTSYIFLYAIHHDLRYACFDATCPSSGRAANANRLILQDSLIPARRIERIAHPCCDVPAFFGDPSKRGAHVRFAPGEPVNHQLSSGPSNCTSSSRPQRLHIRKLAVRLDISLRYFALANPTCSCAMLKT